ncbi:hypothetical protein G6M89_08655 [Natronolimnobius sp. AArcel1]|uniref:HalOD1 output domain-containing protein n=1 Tax=Natronolimnobius sp. AArcel1 TaxID=1679093 RepID=UPI0013EE1F87|nr:HalOD1 output domain-containing protein [Natronolimnobius sp. AArcel1]NGM69078.1 hypothetical protein [Natronolimnobius sp. AArcel1]
MEYHIQSGESASAAVVGALATYTDQPPEEIGPLYDSIEPDALNSLVSHHGEVTIRFRCENTTVEVRSDRICLSTPDDFVSESVPE